MYTKEHAEKAIETVTATMINQDIQADTHSINDSIMMVWIIIIETMVKSY